MPSWMWIGFAVGLIVVTIMFIISEYRFRKTDHELSEAIKKLRQWQTKIKQRRVK